MIPTFAYSQNIGMWRDNSIGMSSTITLYKKNNNYYLSTLLDGSSNTVIEKLKKVKNIYFRIGFSDYYIIDSNGNLNCYDDQGFVFSADAARR
jgi:hypothetical protein